MIFSCSIIECLNLHCKTKGEDNLTKCPKTIWLISILRSGLELVTLTYLYKAVHLLKVNLGTIGGVGKKKCSDPFTDSLFSNFDNYLERHMYMILCFCLIYLTLGFACCWIIRILLTNRDTRVLEKCMHCFGNDHDEPSFHSQRRNCRGPPETEVSSSP